MLESHYGTFITDKINTIYNEDYQNSLMEILFSEYQKSQLKQMLNSLSLNVNFKSGFELNCEIVFPESYLFEAVFYQDCVSARRMRKGNKNYFTFMKSLKIFGKIIFCKRLPQVNKEVR